LQVSDAEIYAALRAATIGKNPQGPSGAPGGTSV